jgi:polyisoprenoid-binding protein YceI
MFSNRRQAGKRAAWALPTLCAAIASLALAAFALAADSQHGSQQVSLQRSSLVASFRQQGITVDAPFKRFDGSIQFDPARPADTHATLHVDMSSLDVGDDDSDAEVRGAAWFDSAHYPQASFHSALAKSVDAQHFNATGDLSIKGRTRQITVNVSVLAADHGYAYDGSFELSRRDFGIGDPTWDAVLDDHVRVRFHLLAAGT